MRLLVTADLHFNHARSRPLAESLIGQINEAEGDVLLVVGDTACGDGESLEQCLSLFRFAGPKLFVAGNHELWTARGDSHALFTHELPARVRGLGWHWLENDPFEAGGTAIVGSVGWYDYSFAQSSLGIPERFYAAKISPGAAERFEELAHLFVPSEDIGATAREVVARWNDGRYVRLGMSDGAFVEERLRALEAGLTSVRGAKRVIAAIHHLPFRALLPSSHGAQWDFAKAYLGSERIGELLLRHRNVSHVFCGHSHLAVEALVNTVHAVNIGSGYRWKTFRSFDFD